MVFLLFAILLIIIIINFLAQVFSDCTEVVATSLIPLVTNFSEICAFIIGKVCEKNTETSNRMLTKFVSIGSYSSEVRTFGTLITSTKVFSLIICKTL